MTVARYVARIAAFAVVQLLAFPFLPLPVAAVWMLAQGRWGLRRFDVIALATLTAAATVATGGGTLSGLGAAVAVTAPAVLFAVLVERWAPGWWLRHGDRFRPGRARLARIAAAAALSAVAALVLRAVITPGMSLSGVLLTLLGETAGTLLLASAARALGAFLPGPPADVAPLARTGGRSRR
ncbi:hypothetical protein Asi03nite_32500 [Actinoplanes siamensis]|uniref:Uncharacterized protein n=1 Tax=Actinoplanes siamensis TaxID=1223317 RepID=A0A919N781_9ACTN|nr:hypothetical protein [Actinoplanes siamensis]GIF05712.1 hypothetical protein Asi03nite_32500 [Actinoplanes siamensis]